MSLAALLYKANIALTTFLVKLGLRSVLGRVLDRSFFELAAIPVTAIWNAIVCFIVVREARLRNDRFEAFAPRTRLRPGSFQGSNMVVHRRVFERVGLFCEDFGSGTPFRCDDIELLARASHAGFSGAFVPELVVHHHHGRRSQQLLRRWQRADDVSRGAYYVAMIAAGHSAYWRDWRRLSLSRRALRRDPRWLERLGYEVVGAAHYALAGAYFGANKNPEGIRQMTEAAKYDKYLDGIRAPKPEESWRYFYRYGRTPLLAPPTTSAG